MDCFGFGWSDFIPPLLSHIWRKKGLPSEFLGVLLWVFYPIIGWNRVCQSTVNFLLVPAVVCSFYSRDSAVPSSNAYAQSKPPQQCCFTEGSFVLWENCIFKDLMKYKAAFVLWMVSSSSSVLKHWKHNCWSRPNLSAIFSCNIAQIWLCIKTHIICEPVKTFKKSDIWIMIYFLSTVTWHLDLFGWCYLPLSMLS